MRYVLSLLLVLVSVQAYGLSTAIQAVVGNTAAAGASCQTGSAWFTQSWDATDTKNVSNTAANLYGGQQGYVPSADKTVCQIGFRLTCVYADCVGKTYTAKIYNMSGNNFGAQVGETSSTVNGSNAWSNTEVNFSFPGVSYPEIVTTGSYAVVVRQSDTGDIYIRAIVDVTGSGTWGNWDTDGVRQDVGSNVDVALKVYVYE